MREIKFRVWNIDEYISLNEANNLTITSTKQSFFIFSTLFRSRLV